MGLRDPEKGGHFRGACGMYASPSTTVIATVSRVCATVTDAWI